LPQEFLINFCPALLFASGSASQVAYTLPHPIWKNEYVDAVKVTHLDPENLTDKLALNTIRLMRYRRPTRHPTVRIYASLTSVARDRLASTSIG
jgi:hypothetical protein